MPRWLRSGRVFRVKEVRTYHPRAELINQEAKVYTTYYGPYSSEQGARSFAGKLRNNVQGPSTAVVTLEETITDWRPV